MREFGEAPGPMSAPGITARLLGVYLWLFALLAVEREHALREHWLIIWSIDEQRSELAAEDRGGARAVALALWHHRGELQPVALYRKTVTDQVTAPGGTGGVRRAIPIAAASAVLVVGSAFVVASALGSDHVHATSQALSDGESGTPANVRWWPSFEEARAHAGGAGEVPATVVPEAPGATAEQGSAPSRAEPEDHCLLHIAPLHAGATTSEVAGAVCFDTFSAAWEEATGVLLDVHLDAPRTAQGVAALLADGNAVGVIGVDFTGSWFTGGTLIWQSTHGAGCEDGSTYAVTSLPPEWDGVISSALALGDCDSFTHYELADQGGVELSCTCEAMLAMHDQTSSLHWSR